MNHTLRPSNPLRRSRTQKSWGPPTRQARTRPLTSAANRHLGHPNSTRSPNITPLAHRSRNSNNSSRRFKIAGMDAKDAGPLCPAAACRLTRHFSVTDRAEVGAEFGAQLLADGQHMPSERRQNALGPRFALSRFPGTLLRLSARCWSPALRRLKTSKYMCSTTPTTAPGYSLRSLSAPAKKSSIIGCYELPGSLRTYCCRTPCGTRDLCRAGIRRNEFGRIAWRARYP
jgi:hypothetical protein